MVSHRLGLGSVAGYLLAGIAIGPWGFQLVDTVDHIRAFAELGVVFLLFVIGLELEPKRLWNMRAQLLGLGLSQVVGSVAAITLIGWALGFELRVAFIAGMALSLSSTALALAPLTERGALATKGGQGTFAVLLFQDIAVIPMLAVIPLLGTASGASAFSWQKLALAAAVVIVTLGGGRLLARPVFRHIARTRLREIFTAFALLLVLVIALAFEHAGLSMALGAFLGGVLLAESEYRHEIEAAIEPFKGLLLGLFFIAVGMSADFAVLAARPWVVFGLIAGLFLVKGIVLWLIARHAGFPRAERPLFILLLAQGGEFAFVLLGVATGHGGLGTDAAPAITLAVAISMLLTPFLLALHDHLAPRFFAAPGEERAPDVPQASKVIVAGLGRVGQVVARMLHASGHQPTVLDDDPDHVEQCANSASACSTATPHASTCCTRPAPTAPTSSSSRSTIRTPSRASPRSRARISQAARDRARARHAPHVRAARRGRGIHRARDLALGAQARRDRGGAGGRRPGRARRTAETFAEHDVDVVAKLYAVHRESPMRASSCPTSCAISSRAR